MEALLGPILMVLTLAPVALTAGLLLLAASKATRCVGVCRRCGYDLRGLGEARQCPECGQPFVVDAHGRAIS